MRGVFGMNKFLEGLKTFFVVWVWQIFMVSWVWEKFCVEWVWRTFMVSWTWKTFLVDIIWHKFMVNTMYKKFDKYKAWIYLAPAIVMLIIFTVWPMINTLSMAFWEDYSIADEHGAEMDKEKYEEMRENIYKETGDYYFTDPYTGEVKYLKPAPSDPYPYVFSVANFTNVINYPQFLRCLGNTMLLCVLTVPISTILALLIAVALNAIKPLRKLLQTIFFLPYVTNSIAIGMVFNAMFNIVGFVGLDKDPQSMGIINNILSIFGIDFVNWINQGSPYWANITVLVIYIVWNALPFKILILLGGLQSINKQYYEAAKIDSTPRYRVFTRITVPLLSPMLAYVVITSFIGGFKEYSSIVGIFGEGMSAPGGTSLNTMVGYIYDQLNADHQGQASAAALILFGIIFIVTMINLYVSKKKTHY